MTSYGNSAEDGGGGAGTKQGNVQPSGTKFPPAFVCSLVSIPLLFIAFYCFYGHASGLLFRLMILVSCEVAVVIYVVILVVLLLLFPRDVLKPGHKAFMAVTVVILLSVAICAAVHYTRYTA